MMKILFNAVPFGYGPASKVAAVIRKLQADGAECVFCGHGIAYEFLRREEICETVWLDLYTKEGRDRLRHLSSSFHYGLTAMEPLFVEHRSLDLPVGYMDSLLWMWEGSHFAQNPSLNAVNHYFIQDSFDARQRAERHGIRNPVFVGSIFDLPEPSGKRRARAIIHFGGVENIFVPFERILYPFGMMKVLGGLISLWSQFDEVLVVSGSRVCERLASLWKHLPLRFATLKHQEFVKTLSESVILVTTPGLTTLLEAFALGVPTIFLPPQNYSQYLILRKLEERGYPLPLMNWPRFFPDREMPTDIPEEIAVCEIARWIEEFFASGEKMESLRTVLAATIPVGELRQSLHDFQAEFIGEIGL